MTALQQNRCGTCISMTNWTVSLGHCRSSDIIYLSLVCPFCCCCEDFLILNKSRLPFQLPSLDPSSRYHLTGEFTHQLLPPKWPGSWQIRRAAEKHLECREGGTPAQLMSAATLHRAADSGSGNVCCFKEMVFPNTVVLLLQCS